MQEQRNAGLPAIHTSRFMPTQNNIGTRPFEDHDRTRRRPQTRRTCNCSQGHVVLLQANTFHQARPTFCTQSLSAFRKCTRVLQMISGRTRRVIVQLIQNVALFRVRCRRHHLAPCVSCILCDTLWRVEQKQALEANKVQVRKLFERRRCFLPIPTTNRGPRGRGALLSSKSASCSTNENCKQKSNETLFLMGVFKEARS
jgi:hypothetical protein